MSECQLKLSAGLWMCTEHGGHRIADICDGALADLRAKLEQGCEVCGHVKGKQQIGPRNPWQIKCEKAEARAKEAEDKYRRLLATNTLIVEDEARWEARARRLEAALIPRIGHKGDCSYIDDGWTCSCGALDAALASENYDSLEGRDG